MKNGKMIIGIVWGICLAFVFPMTLLATKSNGDVFEKAYSIPSEWNGVKTPVISLNGKWKFQYSKEKRWVDIKVPGEVAMQGYAIEHDKPFIYKKSIQVPRDYKGKTIVLRFDGVYSHAKLSINGLFVREHSGGFTRWDTDVTSFVKPGHQNEITLEVTDRLDEISYASGYAHHPIGGILRNVTMFALPTTHLSDMAVETHLDSLYQDAVMKVRFVPIGTGKSDVRIALYSPDWKQVKIEQERFVIEVGGKECSLEIPVNAPQRWDAEHPNLYTLCVSVVSEQGEHSTYTKKIGFRDIKISGDQLLVNGQPVKLRGACRHDIHPTLGRTTTEELDSLDVILFKQANMNFVRTSHYPPTEKFLEYCDRYGVYVESETAVCFVNTHRQKNYAPGNTQDDPKYTAQYLDQCKEMVKAFRSHPSILIWSIGNESSFGSNFLQCWEWVKATDSTRPVVFSYPGSIKEQTKIYDILSMHYQNARGDLSQWGMSTYGFEGHGIPALFDEWAHPACYTYQTLQNDPNIREFWGKSLDMMWSGLFDAKGGLGGAIWSYIDETFALPVPKIGTAFWKEFAYTAKPKEYQGECVGYGEWGIVDVWRRKKPEFWSTKKAYSPIRLLMTHIDDYTVGQRLILPVYNRFDHTDLNEIRVMYTYRGVKRELVLPMVAPHQKGYLNIPAEDWKEGDSLLIEFLTDKNELIDANKVILGREVIDYPEVLSGKTLSVDQNDSLFIVRGKGFEVPFSKKTGLMKNVKAGEDILIEEGPFLNLYVNLNHLSGAEVRKIASSFTTLDTDWKKKEWTLREKQDIVCIDLSGTYKEVNVNFAIKVYANGTLDIAYLVDNAPNGYLREAGLAFYMKEDLQKMTWKRKGYWDYYLPDDFAGNEGSVSLYESKQAKYAEKPLQAWQNDTHNYYYWADAGANCRKPLTQTAKGMKESIYYYTLSNENDHCLSVVSANASVACRLNKRADEQLILYINNRWDYPEIAWGNYCKKLEALPCFGKISMSLR